MSEEQLVALGDDGTRLYVHRRPGPPSADPGGPTALLCDGIACDGFIWKYLWDDLAEHMPVAHWHYRGHGRSGPPADATHTDFVEHVRDVFREALKERTPPASAAPRERPPRLPQAAASRV